MKIFLWCSHIFTDSKTPKSVNVMTVLDASSMNKANKLLARVLTIACNQHLGDVEKLIELCETVPYLITQVDIQSLEKFKNRTRAVSAFHDVVNQS